MRKHVQQEKIEKIKSRVFDNFSFKVVALFISLILWLSILNRRDFIVTKDVDIDFVTAENLTVAGQSSAILKVKVSGPQPLLKKYKESLQVLAFDLTDKGAGFYDVDVPTTRVDVPNGIKILGVKPNSIRVEIIEKSKESK